MSITKVLEKSDTSCNGRIYLPTAAVKEVIIDKMNDRRKKMLFKEGKDFQAVLVNEDGDTQNVLFGWDASRQIFLLKDSCNAAWNLKTGDEVELEYLGFVVGNVMHFKFRRV